MFYELLWHIRNENEIQKLHRSERDEQTINWNISFVFYKTNLLKFTEQHLLKLLLSRLFLLKPHLLSVSFQEKK